MKIAAFFLIFIVAVLGLLTTHTNCSPMGVTVITNPKPKPKQDVVALTSRICEKLNKCNPSRAEKCQSEVLALPGLPAFLGAPESKDLQTLEDFENYRIDLTPVEQCLDGIDNQCSQVSLETLPAAFYNKEICLKAISKTSVTTYKFPVPYIPKTFTGFFVDNKIIAYLTSNQILSGMIAFGNEKEIGSFQVMRPTLEMQKMIPVKNPSGSLFFGITKNPFDIGWVGTSGTLRMKQVETLVEPASADINQDGFADLVTHKNSNEIKIYYGSSLCPFCGDNTKEISTPETIRKIFGRQSGTKNLILYTTSGKILSLNKNLSFEVITSIPLSKSYDEFGFLGEEIVGASNDGKLTLVTKGEKELATLGPSDFVEFDVMEGLALIHYGRDKKSLDIYRSPTNKISLYFPDPIQAATFISLSDAFSVMLSPYDQPSFLVIKIGI